MAKYKLLSQVASIVLIGSFNPAIFHPEWLLRHNLVSPDDNESAELEVVHNDISKFNLDWLSIEVLRNKFVAKTNDPSKFNPLRDLIISVFNILDHTPITQLGMNLNLNYTIENEDDWHKIGDTLAPKEIWNKSLPKRVGLMSLQVICDRDDDYDGNFNVTLQPTKLEKHGLTCIVNNHIEISEEIKKPATSNILSELWESSVDTARKLSETTIREIIE